MKIKICAAQMQVDLWEVEGNFNKAISMVKGASDKGCHIICFPELFLTGPTLEKIGEYAEEIPGTHTGEFSKLAERHGIHIVMGSIAERDGNTYYNTSVLIDSSGKILGKYRKVNLWNGEKAYSTAGNRVPVFDTIFGKIGLQICWDLTFPEISTETAEKGARIIFCPSFWTHEDRYDMTRSADIDKHISHIETEWNFVDACVPARAIENGITYVYANSCGETRVGNDVRHAIGHSQIAVPFQGRIALLEHEEGLLISEVDLGLTEMAERVYEIKKSRKERQTMV